MIAASAVARDVGNRAERTAATPSVAFERADQLLRATWSLLRVGDLGDQQQRTVGAGTEALGEQVVGLARRGVLGEVALVGEAETQAEHRDASARAGTR